MMTTRARTGGSSRTCGGGSGTTATRARRSCSPTSRSSGGASRPTAASGSPRGALAALERRVELFGFHLAKLDVRLHASEVREPTRAHARASSRRSRPRARATAPQALDTVIVSATGRRSRTSSAVLDLTDEPVAVVPLFETIARPRVGGRHRARAARRRALRRARRRARRPARGDGRLLRLRQGRRLPRRRSGRPTARRRRSRRSRARPGSS